MHESTAGSGKMIAKKLPSVPTLNNNKKRYSLCDPALDRHPFAPDGVMPLLVGD